MTTTMTAKLRKELIAAYRYFNPYWWEGDLCNPWSSLLVGYRRALVNPYHRHDAERLGFVRWLINEANESWFEKTHDL
jgi:hypothetical protein